MTMEAHPVRLNFLTAHQISLTSASLFQFTPQSLPASTRWPPRKRGVIGEVPRCRVPQPTAMLDGIEHKGSCACHPILFIERNVDVANPAAHRPCKSRQVAAKPPTVIANPTTPRSAERWLDQHWNTSPPHFHIPSHDCPSRSRQCDVAESGHITPRGCHRYSPFKPQGSTAVLPADVKDAQVPPQQGTTLPDIGRTITTPNFPLAILYGDVI